MVLVISPQSIAGYSIHQLLVDTVEEAAGRPVIIINPNLKDRPSSGGVMQVRGRGDRIAFAESFKDVYNFRLLYASSVAFFPIKVRMYAGFSRCVYPSSHTRVETKHALQHVPSKAHKKKEM